MTAPTADLLRVRITGTADLLTAIPYLIGFRPVDSVVLVGLADGEAGPVARFDDAALATPASAAELGDWAGGWLAKQHAEEVIVVHYGDPVAAGDGLAALRDGLHRSVAVADLLSVAGGRYRSLLCLDETCCPEAGRPLPQPRDSAVAAALVSAGKVAHEHRDELVADLAVDLDEAMTAAVDAALTAWRQASPAGAQERRAAALRMLVAALRRVARTPIQQPVAPVADGPAILAGLQDVLVRDAALAFCLPPWREHLERLLVALLPGAAGPHAAAPLTLLVAISWSAGQGTRANLLVDRALAADPDYRLARLWERALTMGLPPREVEAICRGAGRAVVRDLIGRMPTPPTTRPRRRPGGR